MKTKLLTTLIILLFCSTVFAQREQNKIGYIDIDYILNELPDFKEANNELNQKIETWKGEIELKQEKIRGLKEDLENERPLLTQDLIDERQDEIDYYQKELQNYQTDVDLWIAELRQSVNENSEQLALAHLELAELKEQLARQTEALTRADGQILSVVDDVRHDVKSIEDHFAEQIASLRDDRVEAQQRLDEIEQEIIVLQSQVGLSEEQVTDLTRRVREEMAEQLSLSLAREGELQRNLRDLREEFDSYRKSSEEQLKSAGSAQALSIGALAVGLIALLVN